jgi:hypothetical protein
MEEKPLSSDDNYHSQYNQQSCFYCYGKGFTSCYDCSSAGNIICFACKGSGKIKSYMQLTVKFENNHDECFKKPEYIPEQFIRSCNAQLVFSEQGETVY